MDTVINIPAISPGQAVPTKVLSREDRIRAEARDVAESFEALFLSQMFEHMTSGLEVDPTFGGGPGEKAFRSLLNSEYATGIAEAGGIGVAEPIYQEILKLQEVEP
jgi:Rod binding domain-containing protein